MPYQHGIYIQENPTAVATPTQSLSTIAVVVGTAPVNLVSNPAINKPIVAKSYAEAVAALGYSDDFANYTICEVVDAFFKKFQVGPLVLINVLDPSVHNTPVPEQTVSILNGAAKLNTLGVLLDDTFLVKDSTGATTYVKDTDYTVAFDSNGYPIITRISNGTIPANATELKVTCTKIDPTKVTEADIIGSYTSATNTYKGIECIAQVYPMFNLVPGLLLVPGYSQNMDVGVALKGKENAINGSFNAEALLDLDSSTAKVIADAIALKATNGFNGKNDLVLWPKVKIGDVVYWYSSILAALIVYTDTQNKDVPFKSPSNKKLPISSAVLADGTEVFLDQVQANELNAEGIITAINMSGWRVWGNNTGVYPGSTDPKDRFIAVRRVFDWWGNSFIVDFFDWWGNSFIVDFFDKVDDPTNYRLIESVVDEENIKSNGYQAAGQIAGAKITFNQADNPTDNILNGKITFKQSLGAFPPAEDIVNVLEFDPNLLSNSLFGGGN